MFGPPKTLEGILCPRSGDIDAGENADSGTDVEVTAVVVSVWTKTVVDGLGDGNEVCNKESCREESTHNVQCNRGGLEGGNEGFGSGSTLAFSVLGRRGGGLASPLGRGARPSLFGGRCILGGVSHRERGESADPEAAQAVAILSLQPNPVGLVLGESDTAESLVERRRFDGAGGVREA